MKSFIKKKYYSLCARIYGVGREAYEKKHLALLNKRGVIGEKTRFYSGAQILNLANNKELITVGNNCHISGQLTIFKNGKIKIGDNCSLGDMSRIVSGKNIEIGSRVLIAHNVNILDNNSHSMDAVLRHEDFLFNYAGEMKEYDLKANEIIIEDDVWIGFNSIILKGVKIGRGAIIGAGSIVTKNVEPWTVNVGNPLRCIQQLEPQNF